MNERSTKTTVVKIGGSLFDLPDLGHRLRMFLAGLETANVFLVPGGGRAADLVRVWDRQHGLGQDTAHWLALRAMTLNAHLLAAILPGGHIVSSCQKRDGVFRVPGPMIVDAHAWALEDEQGSEQLPRSWEVTSDSLALRFALQSGASELILLKSVDLPQRQSWVEAAAAGLIDAFFPHVLEQAGTMLAVHFINFRQWPNQAGAE